MKVLCLSDLHFRSEAVVDLIDHGRRSSFVASVERLVGELSPDVVVVTGDTVCAEQVRLLSALWERLIPDGIPVITSLGNHEFWGRTFEVTLNKLKEQVCENKNVFYLDNIGSVEIGGVNFVGGMLFFDGSMRYRENQRVDEWDGWQDWRIIDVETRYLDIHKYYVDMIRSCMKPGMPTALCTHHLPHERLNGHAPSHYNFYSGAKDLVHELPFDPMYDNYLICGHTHRRVIGEVVPGFMGINVGSEYGRIEHYLVEM